MRSPERIPVLLYHSVAGTADPRFARWVVSPEAFEEQMALLADGGYRTMTVTELARRIWDEGRPVPPRTVVITFDDGFADFHESAWPCLRRHGLTATVYVTTGHVGGRSEWLAPFGEDRRPMMSWEQLDEVARGGIELGAHGEQHLPLDQLAPARAATQVERSCRALAERIGPVASFAYPHGYHNRSVRNAVRRAGLTSACAVADGLCTRANDRFAITRAIVAGDTSLHTVERIADGLGSAPGRRILRRAVWRAARRSGVAG